MGTMTVALSIGQEPYSILIERIKKPGSKKTVFDKAYSWMQSDPDFKIVEKNFDKGRLKAEAKFDYPNKVDLEDVSTSPGIGEKTSGLVKYEIMVTVTDTSYSIEFTNFRHVSVFDAGQFSFGIIPKNPEDFNKQCTEDYEWCKLVWMDITKTARMKTRMKRMKANWWEVRTYLASAKQCEN